MAYAWVMHAESSKNAWFWEIIRKSESGREEVASGRFPRWLVAVAALLYALAGAYPTTISLTCRRGGNITSL